MLVRRLGAVLLAQIDCCLNHEKVSHITHDGDSTNDESATEHCKGIMRVCKTMVSMLPGYLT